MKEERASPVARDRASAWGRRGALWLLTVGPGLWAAHFLLSYTTAAIWCARVAAPGASLSGARLLIAAYTLLAVLGIGLTAWRGFRQAGLRGGSAGLEEDSPVARRRFLGYATGLLALLSLIATLYVALGAAVFGSCL